ncbi:glucose-6-phosphate dehydrogenase (coenzyme-F420) [Mycobacterium tuberculosis]|nr:glucose-6-phosphate dehydrogenase (coenzyme-F420) [Mycobacterium tuberculosis]CFA93966.1 F420-dependent glucose-6-phosphate dehydrogenase [Mycobacterium tuberculosis]
MAELKLGYKASAEQFAPRELVELAVAAEAHGMDSATVSDHFQPWRHQGGHAPFSLSWMTAVGERTNRLLLGTSVLTPTFRYNPAVIAQAFATMGCLYPNRVFLGVGTGEALNEIATGYEGAWPEFKERFARLRESVGLMRQLWSGDRVDFDGDYYRLKGASIYDVPDGGVPVYIAAGGGGAFSYRRHQLLGVELLALAGRTDEAVTGAAGVLGHRRGAGGPAVAKYAGRAGDGFICTSGKGEELYTEKLMPAVREGAAAADRSVDGIDKMIEIKISYDPDPELALNNTRFWAPLSLTAEQKHSIDDPIEMEKAADALPIEQIAKRWIVASDPDEAVEKVGQYVTWGLNHLVFHAPGHDQRRFLELFQSDLAPRLRRLG